jgi:hypothetical protein
VDEHKRRRYYMINVEGYRAFRGTMRITPKNGIKPFDIEGDWLYKPDFGCWYGQGRSFAEEICEVVEDRT